MFQAALRRTVLPASVLGAVTLLAAGSLAGVARSQANYDIVELTDGTVLDQVRVEKFDLRELVVRERSSERKIEREKVFNVRLESDAARRLFKDAEKAVSEQNWALAFQEYMKAAEDASKRSGLKDYAPQFALWRAYELAKVYGSADDRKEILGELLRVAPETGFYPNIWEYRIERALAEGDDKATLQEAKDVIAQFAKFAEEKLSEKYRIEADMFETQVKLRLRELSGAEAQKKYQELLAKVKGRYQGLANRLNLDIANAELVQNNIQAARELFREILKSGVADESTMIGAYVGVGHTYMREPERTKEHGRLALSNYLRPVILYPEGDVERLGEACYNAIKAYQVWDPNARTEMRRIYTRLKRNYGASSWASKDL